MAIGNLIQEARERKQLTQEELAERIPFTRGSVSHFERGSRELNRDDYAIFCEGLDDARFTLELHRASTGGVYIPYLDGPKVDHHPASLTYLARKELKEAKEHITKINFSKPISVMEEFELNHIERTVQELLDAQAAAQTLVINLCSHLEISFNDQVKRWIGSRTATGHISRRNL
ncbi:helix-turn-helix domain-containing protein [Bacillus suaedae]|uniref:Helix-turn-helix transcriptional regulator n=1 Tax=Halalkalibacter suaedae TaxID=2822140 RepID=A0A940WYE0_9BACI|nr:helix-turn-helix transcriptional regulator [Bacillus suaedae]MBP3950304.1 helix-turn-helix transcriptional regulator [Bacillus suaedae]